MILQTVLLLTISQGLPDAPKPKAPVIEKFKPSPLAVAQSAALIFDGITTRQHLAQGTGWEENHVASPFIGSHPEWNKMIPIGIAEVAACEILARKHPRAKWLQVAFIGLHVVAGSRNLTLEPIRNETRTLSKNHR